MWWSRASHDCREFLDQGTRELQSAAQAAEALRPLAGNFAFALFALGVIGTGLLAVPVLAGSAAYALCKSILRNDCGSNPAGSSRQRFTYPSNQGLSMVRCAQCPYRRSRHGAAREDWIESEDHGRVGHFARITLPRMACNGGNGACISGIHRIAFSLEASERGGP